MGHAGACKPDAGTGLAAGIASLGAKRFHVEGLFSKRRKSLAVSLGAPNLRSQNV